MKNNLPANTTKAQALKALKTLRLTKPSAKLFAEQGVYCQPGRGLATFCNYFLVA